LGPSPAGTQQLRKAIDVFPTSKAVDTLVSFHISQGWLLFHIRNVARDHLSSREQKRRLHVRNVLHFILTGDYVAALQILSEFVEFVEAYVAAGARGNYNATLHRYICVNKDANVHTRISYRNTMRCNTMILIIRCEVTRVLLLLILQPSPQRLTPSLAQVLEKYAWAEENANNGKIYLSLTLQSYESSRFCHPCPYNGRFDS